MLPNTTVGQHDATQRLFGGGSSGCPGNTPECTRRLGPPVHGTTTGGSTGATGSTGSTGSGAGASGGTGGTPTTPPAAAVDFQALLKKYWPLIAIAALYFWAGAE